jgi:hypothetical protein
MEFVMLEYLALGILVFVALTLFYGIIVIHDIPYEIAKHRNHPQQDALHVAGWVSLFTLHILWPFLWIWATLYREDRGWGFSEKGNVAVDNSANETQFQVLNERIEKLEKSLQESKQNRATELKTTHDSFSEMEGSIIADQEGSK